MRRYNHLSLCIRGAAQGDLSTYRRERATGSMVRTLSTKWCPSRIPPIINRPISKLTPPVTIPFRGVRRPALLAAETATFPCVNVRPFSTHDLDLTILDRTLKKAGHSRARTRSPRTLCEMSAAAAAGSSGGVPRYRTESPNCHTRGPLSRI